MLRQLGISNNTAMYIVDGNNLMGQLRTRREILELLADFSDRTGAEVVVVFDGTPDSVFPEGCLWRAVRVHYSLRGFSADVRIQQLVKKHHQADHVVVTSDKALASSVRSLGAKQISTEQFLSGLFRKRPEKKPDYDGKLNEWLRYFGCEPQEADSDEI